MSYYSQNDPRWKNRALGHNPYATIGQFGCFVTAFANVVTAFGHDTTPQAMNDTMLSRGWFSPGTELVSEHKVPNLLYPQDIAWAGETHWDFGNAPVNFFADAGDPNTRYIIYVDVSPAGGVQSHFTMVESFTATLSGMDLIIADSWDGQHRKLSTYGKPSAILLAAYKFKRINPGKGAGQSMPDNPDLLINRGDVTNLVRDLFGHEPTPDDFKYAGSTWKHTIENMLGNSQFRQRVVEAVNEGDAVNLWRAMQGRTDGQPDQATKDLIMSKNWKSVVYDVVIPALTGSHRPALTDDQRRMLEELAAVVDKYK